MDMYKLKWTRLQSEILRLLCIKSGQILNLRGIANCLKVSPTAVAKLPALQPVGYPVRLTQPKIKFSPMLKFIIVTFLFVRLECLKAFASI